MKDLKVLKHFFKLSITCFLFASKVKEIFGSTMSEKEKQMVSLHVSALKELNKKNPDQAVVYKLLMKMEILSSIPPVPKEFESGGYVSKTKKPIKLDKNDKNN